MAMRQVTFEIPEEVAKQFDSHVPASEQSGVVAKLLQSASRPRLTDEQWAAACDAANNDPETQEIEGEPGKTSASRKTRQLQDAKMIAACDALNADPDIAELERDMDALSGDGLDEYPWSETASW
jgi:hypothetical protein